ncbi:MAG: bifunctional 5,10-methylenetetrahydrofolate dehydrogenase/5,10-methenyltetrahydrofolate cyclohydrolase [Proteobacteria bacterium]|nr:MAG: bifunctional 5,10-methylenetetrahydrofolate dehydrogenase/5,10-methenyltetrahydrofolate cyclohydrolase [Pseudomonadota bacterium]
MTARLINGTDIAKTVKEKLRQRIQDLGAEGFRAPCLAVVLVGGDPASEIYVGHKKKACAAIGIQSKALHLDENISQDELASELIALNENSEIDGILLQLPLPKHLDSRAAIDLISPEKDVDGLTPFNQGLIPWKRRGMIPCTPLGVMHMIRETGLNLSGARAVVIGRSVLVGAPLASLLGHSGATVTAINSQTKAPWELTRIADVIVAAAGAKRLVKGSWVKPGAVVIDVGMHRDQGKLCGDVDFDEVKDVAGWITPVPGGVGPMTIAYLLANCVEAFEKKFHVFRGETSL